MTSAVCITPSSSVHRPLMAMDYPFSRNSNSAGAPLPLIPRRPSSSHRTQSHARHSSAPLTASVYLNVQPPTPPGVDPPSSDTPSDSSDSSSSTRTASDEVHPMIAPRAKRIRGYRPPPLQSSPEQSTPSAEHSTPTFSTKNLFSAIVSPQLEKTPGKVGDKVTEPHNYDDDTPRASQPRKAVAEIRPIQTRLATSGLHPRNLSESSVAAFAVLQAQMTPPKIAPPEGQTLSEERTIRKKSGELLKSSLKSMKRPPRGSITVVTGAGTSKSEPATPTLNKNVHFDAKLEHVKLFLAEQKPLAVSRDGSPTTDTSGTDNEFPSFIYGSGSEQELARKSLLMKVTNMPLTVDTTADVTVLSLALSDDKSNIHGRVRVRNLAFEKWIAVRFTFDWWQTTSEVTAKYAETEPGNKFDIFTFMIKLQDILSRVNEKTLLLAVRYSVAGREIWDNNRGRNYEVQFSKMISSGQQEKGAAAIEKLHTKLENVVNVREGKGSVLPRDRQPSPSGYVEKPPPLNSETSLSSRYDFAASLKSPWRGPRSPSPSQHFRTSTYPASPNSVPWPEKGAQSRNKSMPAVVRRALPMGSPRDMSSDEGLATVRKVPLDDDLPFQVKMRARSKNHQRGYFDVAMPGATSLKRTPPGTPRSPPLEDQWTSPPQHQRYHSYPSGQGGSPRSGLTGSWQRQSRFELGSSEESTPSITSPSSSSRSSSPDPRESVFSKGSNDSQDFDNYSAFLNRFCFYTGSDSLLDVSVDIPRSHSASSVEEFLSSQSPPLGFERDLSSPFSAHTRSSSFDDNAYRSGSSTPTPNRLMPSLSRSSTPVAG